MKFLKTVQFGLQLHDEYDILYDHIKIFLLFKSWRKPWPGSSSGYSAVLISQGRGFILGQDMYKNQPMNA